MSLTAPPSDKTGERASSALTPPDERFWQHYSPHAEFPLSSAGSLLLHLLMFGLVGLMAVLSTWLLSHANRSLPIEAVRISGGGGDRFGHGDGPNNGKPIEAGERSGEKAAENISTHEEALPQLKVPPAPKMKPNFDVKPGRQINPASGTFARLRQGAREIQSSNSEPAGRGQGGPGEGGGKGSGKGTGKGNGRGEGKANLTQREKRQLRWWMQVSYTTGADYVDQLQGVGAVLAIPVAENGDDFDYKFIRDLSARPAKPVKEDVQKILAEFGGLIRWYENNPKNAAGVLSALGLPLPKIPRKKLHFVAFMPQKLEKELLRLELAYLEAQYPGRNEEDIVETKFRIKVREGKYEPEVFELNLN